MFDKQLESLCQEINRHHHVFKQLQEKEEIFRGFISAEILIDDFLQSQNRIWQSSVLNALIRQSQNPRFQQYCYTFITRLFWRNLTYLSSGCQSRQISSEDLLSQANLILLEQVVKASSKPPQEKRYINLTLNLKRDFYIFVEANDFQFSEISDNYTEETIPFIDSDKIIKQILLTNLLSREEIDLWLEVERDSRSLKEIADEKGFKYDAFQKKMRRLNNKIEKHSK